MSIRKRDFLKSTIALGMAWPAQPSARRDVIFDRRRPEDAARLNLLFITADDLDWSVAGFMGAFPNATPNLDALASHCHRFVNNRTVAPICMPSRQAIMSGLLPHHSGGTGFIPMHDGTPTLTSILKHEGYFTAAIHKVDHMLPAMSFPWDYVQRGVNRDTSIYPRGFALAAAEARGQRKPFFIQCNINDPHRPFYGSNDAAEMDHGQLGAYSVAREITPDQVVIPPMLDDLPAIRVELAQYYNSVQRLDLALGLILDELRISGETDRTVIAFCSDHGMPFPFAKATCYDHGTRVPVLLSWPGMGQPRQFDHFTTSVDILPTLLELLGAPKPMVLDGHSWLPVINGESMDKAHCVVTYVDEVASGIAYPTRAIHIPGYSLIFSAWSDGALTFNVDGMRGLSFAAMQEAAHGSASIAARVKQLEYGEPLAFYDLRHDPGQRVNLIRSLPHRTVIDRLKHQLAAEMRQRRDPQLENYLAVLAGNAAIVKQESAKYQIRATD